MNNKKEHVETWVRRISRDERLNLTEREIDRAATIGADTWKGNVGVGQAAENGIAAIKRMRE